jgi:NADPH-dependent 2,4-dienoyl-CoA reductase/sulfur reductase-like enzyme
MSERKTIVIVGGNAAGPAAAAKAKRVDPDADVLMIEQNEFISTGTCELPYVISGEVSSHEKIVYFDEESFEEKKGARVSAMSRVEEIDRKARELTVRNVNDDSTWRQRYDKLILATGSVAKSVPTIPADATNVFRLKSVPHVVELKNYVEREKPQSAVVVGSGYIGLETAEAFRKLECDVKIVELASAPMPQAEREIRKLVETTLEDEGVEFVGGVEDMEAFVEDGRIVRMKGGGKRFDADVVVVSVGVAPETRLAENAGLDVGVFGALQVDNAMRTSDPNIYAAGDCAEVVNGVTLRPDYVPLAAYARDGGYTAGENAAGGNARYHPVFRNASMRLFDRFYAGVGLTEPEAKKAGFVFASASATAFNRVHVMPGAGKVFGKIIFEKDTKRLLGGAFFGGREVSGYVDVVSTLIAHKLPAGALAQTEYNYNPPLSPFVNLLSILGKKAGA